MMVGFPVTSTSVQHFGSKSTSHSFACIALQLKELGGPSLCCHCLENMNKSLPDDLWPGLRERIRNLLLCIQTCIWSSPFLTNHPGWGVSTQWEQKLCGHWNTVKLLFFLKSIKLQPKGVISLSSRFSLLPLRHCVSFNLCWQETTTATTEVLIDIQVWLDRVYCPGCSAAKTSSVPRGSEQL